MPLSAPATGSFIEFPDRLGVLHRLRAIEVYELGMEPLFQLVADRLEGRAYDRSAFVFILLELIYELDLDTITFSDMLGRLVFALSEDLELVGEALEAFSEVQQTLGRAQTSETSAPDGKAPKDQALGDRALGEQAPEQRADASAKSIANEDGLAWQTDLDHEHLMLELQQTQKQCLDFGLGARLSIEMALTHPSRSNVRHTMRDISQLRRSLTRFEELLRESEERLLEAIGILDRD